MPRGRKPLAPSEKESRGTLIPSRDAGRGEIIAPNETVCRPDWLTAEGEMVWIDDFPRVQSVSGAREVDTTLFGNYCNLQGMINRRWGQDECPPITAMTEVRRMQEALRIAGPSSRVTKGGDEPKSGNPFKRHGQRAKP